MARLSIVVFVIGLVFAVLALISVLAAENGEVRGLPRPFWVLIILFFPLIGSLAYFFAGRPTPIATTGGHRVGRAPRPTRTGRAVAPDDDPEFLRRLDEQMRQRREEDRRRQQRPDDDPAASI